jgi:hypothetical protein
MLGVFAHLDEQRLVIDRRSPLSTKSRTDETARSCARAASGRNACGPSVSVSGRASWQVSPGQLAGRWVRFMQ